jgi:hypothetical protein
MTEDATTTANPSHTARVEAPERIGVFSGGAKAGAAPVVMVVVDMAGTITDN